MCTRTPCRELPLNLLRLAGLMLLGVSATAPAYVSLEPEIIPAESGDVIRPYVLGSVTYDDNLFRVSGKDEARQVQGTSHMSDTIYSVGAGVDVNLQVSRQQFLFDALVRRNWFDRFDFLDYTGGDGRAEWKWLYGRMWSGDLGYRYNRSLSGFGENQAAIQDIRTGQSGFADAEMKLTPRWLVRGGADWTRADFSERDQLDRRRNTGSLGLHYVTLANNTLGIQGQLNDVHFTNRPSGLADNDYTDKEIDAVATWAVSGHSQLSGRAGYLRREHEELSQNDFSGLVARFDWLWQLTGKTSITTSAWRELSSLSDEVTNYSVVKGVGIQPKWAATSKITLTAGAFYENRDFRGSSGTATTDSVASGTEDDVYTFNAYLLYNPLRRIHLSVGYQHERRDSTTALREYTYNTVLGAVQVDF